MLQPDDFETAQEVRNVLNRHDWSPLTKIGSAEHWVKRSQRCVLVWDGDEPGCVPPRKWHHVAIHRSTCEGQCLTVEHYPNLSVVSDEIAMLQP